MGFFHRFICGGVGPKGRMRHAYIIEAEGRLNEGEILRYRVSTAVQMWRLNSDQMNSLLSYSKILMSHANKLENCVQKAAPSERKDLHSVKQHINMLHI